MPQPLPRYLLHELQERETREKIARILVEVGEVEDVRGKPLRSSADGHRDDRRRGLPMIGRGVSGATDGSDPLQALLRKERGRRRQ